MIASHAMVLLVAQNAAEESSGQNPGILDTLALAYFLTGDIAKAFETEEKAISLLPPSDKETRKDLEKSLTRFRAGVTSQPAATQPATTQPSSRPMLQPTSRPT